MYYVSLARLSKWWWAHIYPGGADETIELHLLYIKVCNDNSN